MKYEVEVEERNFIFLCPPSALFSTFFSTRHRYQRSSRRQTVLTARFRQYKLYQKTGAECLTFSKQFVEPKKANEASEGEHFGNITPEGVADPSSPDASGESLSNSAAEGQGGEMSGSWSRKVERLKFGRFEMKNLKLNEVINRGETELKKTEGKKRKSPCTPYREKGKGKEIPDGDGFMYKSPRPRVRVRTRGARRGSRS